MDGKTNVDGFFDVMGITESKQLKMVAIKLENTVAVWWDKLVLQRKRQRKEPLQDLEADKAIDVSEIFTRSL